MEAAIWYLPVLALQDFLYMAHMHVHKEMDTHAYMCRGSTNTHSCMYMHTCMHVSYNTSTS